MRLSTRAARRRGAAAVTVGTLAVVLAAAGCAPDRRGATGDPGTPPPASVSAPASASASPSASPSAPSAGPTFADLGRDAKTTATLHAVDIAARSAVVEPTTVLTGDEACTAELGEPVENPDDCPGIPYTVRSRSKYTLPLAGDVWLGSIGDRDADCVDGETGEATCRITEARFAAWAKRTPEAPVVVTVRNGVITRIAELYEP
jgi:hypothetical protein